MYHLLYSGASPQCTSTAVCWCVPFDPSPWLHPSHSHSPIGQERNEEQLGRSSRKDKVSQSGEERLLTLHRDPAFLRSKVLFPVFFGTRYDPAPYFVCFSLFLSFDMLWYFGSRRLAFPSVACWILYPCTARRV